MMAKVARARYSQCWGEWTIDSIIICPRAIRKAVTAASLASIPSPVNSLNIVRTRAANSYFTDADFTSGSLRWCDVNELAILYQHWATDNDKLCVCLYCGSWAAGTCEVLWLASVWANCKALRILFCAELATFWNKRFCITPVATLSGLSSTAGTWQCNGVDPTNWAV